MPELDEIWDQIQETRLPIGDWRALESATLQMLHNKASDSYWYRHPPETEWQPVTHVSADNAEGA